MPPNTNSKRKLYDWEAIEKAFRAGCQSTREIAAEHGCTEAAIRQHARKDGWDRNLGNKIRQGVEAELLRRDTQCELRTEKSIIIKAVSMRVGITEAQRLRAGKLSKIADSLIDKLETYGTDSLITWAHSDAAFGVLLKATKAVGLLIDYERRVWGLEETPGAETPSASAELMRRLKEMGEREGS